MPDVEPGQIWVDVQYPTVLKVTKITKERHPNDASAEIEVVHGVDINTGKEVVDYKGKFGFFYRLRVDGDDRPSPIRYMHDNIQEKQSE